MSDQKHIRNFSIIAHIDHGKSTLSDRLIEKCGAVEQRIMEDQILDNMDLEKERGITIKARAVGLNYTAADGENYTLNLIDTPGHVDFNYEVSRSLAACEGALLVVDASQGVEAQTLANTYLAMNHDLEILPVINKIDLPAADPARTKTEIEDIIGIPAMEAPEISAKNGINIPAVLEEIVRGVPAPKGDPDAPLQILFSNIEYDDYLGRIGVGRVIRGTVKVGQTVALCHKDGTTSNVKIAKLFMYRGLKRVEEESASVGDIIQVAGIADLEIGETACATDCIEPLPFVKIDEPTLAMNFMVNNSPFAGKDGKFVTSRNLRDRLFREVMTNVSLRVEETDSADTFKVSGRGELHLSILIETMRRQGYEFQVSPPEVIYKKGDNGELLEPIELLMIEVPEEYVGSVMERLGTRKAEIKNMGTRDGGVSHLEFLIPARGLLGYRSQFLTDTNGNGIMNHVFDSYQPYKGDIEQRSTGSIIAHETGEATGYGLFNTQSRGRLFIGAGTPVYEGMIVGENPKNEDIVCNVCKKKQMTNTRAAGSDDALRLVPPTRLSLEQSLEFIKNDELVEITPHNIRLRKRILNKEERMKAESRRKQ